MKYFLTLSLAFLCMAQSTFGQHNNDLPYSSITKLNEAIYNAFKEKDFTHLLSFIPSEHDISLLKEYESKDGETTYNYIEQGKNNWVKGDDIQALNFRISLLKKSFSTTMKALENANVNTASLRVNIKDGYTDNDHWKITKSFIDSKTKNIILTMIFSLYERKQGSTYWTGIKYNVMATPRGYILLYDFKNSFEILYYDIKYGNIPKD